MKRFLITSLMLVAVICQLSVTAYSQKDDSELNQARQISTDRSLFFALAANDINAMVALRDRGANLNASLAMLGLKAKDVFGDTQPILTRAFAFDLASWPILHWAVYLDNQEAAKMLLHAGARVNTPDVYGATALHWAAWGGRHDIGKLLLNNGASCQAKDIKQRTSRDWAVIMGQTDMTRLFDSRVCRAAAILDSDGDGVPDDQDLCPNTPFGAPVDERGCWVVAYASFFDFDKSVVKSQYLPAIESAAIVLKNHPDLIVEIEGHTDSIGTDEYNYGLGMRRAQAVKKVLVANGVSAERLKTTSRGERQPIASNSSANGRTRNRRVEIQVAQPGAAAKASVTDTEQVLVK